MMDSVMDRRGNVRRRPSSACLVADRMYCSGGVEAGGDGRLGSPALLRRPPQSDSLAGTAASAALLRRAPVIAVNDKPVLFARSAPGSKAGHRRYSPTFEFGAVEDDENDDDGGSFSSLHDKFSMEIAGAGFYKQMNNYSSAFGGDFSTFSFEEPQAVGVTAGSSSSSIGSALECGGPCTPLRDSHRRRSSTATVSSAFKLHSRSDIYGKQRHKRTMSSNNNSQAKRLVQEFLKVDKDPSPPRRNSSSQLNSSSSLVFENLLYRELDHSSKYSMSAVANESERSLPRTPFTDRNLASAVSSASIVGTPSTSGDHSSPPQSRESDIFSSSPEMDSSASSLDVQVKKSVKRKIPYKEHIPTAIHQLELKLRDQVQRKIVADESRLIDNLNKFDTLTTDVAQLRDQISTLKMAIKDTYLPKIRRSFDPKNSESFIHTLQDNVNTAVQELEVLEKKMQHYQRKVAQQKETMKTLESLINMGNTLREVKRNTKSVYKYRYVLFDLCILSFAIYFVMLLRSLFW
ncbi:uncharacterized protein KNAG_0L00440 [Huiozyma naganishii CBS 8797]|uniref:Uncharacterized protein n=1 Tax=Huiozyma naganishii (strain ATCC MYA-139 / BCRC 22969 / CBS 8797 / KCTC 17520 / NBRC 10181 / NCYC 3082 / Yp74L-3) TaxID=1071383 RepID=J7S3J8_HUIN7|nr:hypothetical protein KNAG_0L00440 [Kazachstania naganishii CBS 8797]CCK72667.1 hypothetical protein KNAG_0L00440 [Kazachstania naganishii CBS 8797]